MKTLLLTTGGTGGHIYPALAVAKSAMKYLPDASVFLAGRKNSIEEQLANKYHIKFVPVRTVKISRKISFRLLLLPFEILSVLIGAINIVMKIKPNIIFGFGGYVSFPIMLAGVFLRIPLLIHEQNIMLGTVNKFFLKFAKSLFISFPRLLDGNNKKFIYTGNPSRFSYLLPDKVSNCDEYLRMIDKETVRKKLKLDKDKNTILVFGGSQGAVSLNKAVLGLVKLLIKLKKNIQIIHLCGRNNYDFIKEEYKKIFTVDGKFESAFLSPQATAPSANCQPPTANCHSDMYGDTTIMEIKFPDISKLKVLLRGYLEEMELAYSAADIVISRSGASTLSEIAFFGIPAIFIPYPYSTANHQLKNAKYVENANACYVVLDSDVTPEILQDKTDLLLNNSANYLKMCNNSKNLFKKDAVEKMVQEIEKYLQ